jgi:hypothetical protein
MYLTLYEIEKSRSTKFDGIHDYSVIEKIPEDYLRSTIRKKERNLR